MGHPILTFRRRLTRLFINAAFCVDPDPPLSFTTPRYTDTTDADGTTLRNVTVYGPGGEQVWPTP